MQDCWKHRYDLQWTYIRIYYVWRTTRLIHETSIFILFLILSSYLRFYWYASQFTFFFFFVLRASLQSFPPHQRLGHSFLPKRAQIRDLKVGWNFYRQVCLYDYKFHVKNKLKKKQHKYVVVKGVRRWMIKEINYGGYLFLSLIDDWIAKYLTR